MARVSLFRNIICRTLSIAFFLYGKGTAVYEEVIKTLDVPKRLNIISYFSDSAEPYPINKLRNIALDHVQTTHFWLADMDMWPARIIQFILLNVVDLYKTLVSLPRSFLARDDTVTIVPAFEYPLPKDTECNSFTSCIMKYTFPTLFI